MGAQADVILVFSDGVATPVSLIPPPAIPTQHIVEPTGTGTYCFRYEGPDVGVSELAGLFASSVAAINRLNLPDGNFSSWFRAAPDLASLTGTSNDDHICVAAPSGLPVFATGGAATPTATAPSTATPTATATPWLLIRGAYTFTMEADPSGVCGWPVTTFYWPVSVQATSYTQGVMVGWVVFPPLQAARPNTWSIYASSTRTELIPGDETPGPAGGPYDVVVVGGSWEAGGPTRAPDGRGQITDGTASGSLQILTLRGSNQHWECRSDAKWNLIVRYADAD